MIYLQKIDTIVENYYLHFNKSIRTHKDQFKKKYISFTPTLTPTQTDQ